MTTVRFIRHDGTPLDATAEGEETLLALAQAHGLPLEGTCEGQMACATCHVILDARVASALPPPVDAEEDMLDMAVGARATSRLSCQVALRDLPDGAVVHLP